MHGWMSARDGGRKGKAERPFSKKERVPTGTLESRRKPWTKRVKNSNGRLQARLRCCSPSSCCVRFSATRTCSARKARGACWPGGWRWLWACCAPRGCCACCPPRAKGCAGRCWRRFSRCAFWRRPMWAGRWWWVPPETGISASCCAPRWTLRQTVRRAAFISTISPTTSRSCCCWQGCSVCCGPVV